MYATHAHATTKICAAVMSEQEVGLRECLSLSKSLRESNDEEILPIVHLGVCTINN